MGGKRRQEGAQQFIIHHIIHNSPLCKGSSVSLLPNPESKILPNST